jgi:hypothetical protein
MSKYSEFFLNSSSRVVELETLEISHPNFTQTYYIVRNAINGITVKLENGNEQFFQYYPLKIEANKASDDLDQTLKVHLGDLGELLPKELDAVAVANGFGIKPTVIYRTYRSDDLTAPLNGPIRFEIAKIPFQEDGATFEAQAPRLNTTATGELYSLDRFPMLRAFV